MDFGNIGNNFRGAFFPRNEGDENAPAVPPRGPAPPEANAGVGGNNLPPLNNREIALEEGGVIEAGVANPAYQSSGAEVDGRLSTEMDLVLFFHCHENLQTFPESVAKRGTTISIGLEKTTGLRTVFAHFARFCTNSSNNKEPIIESELEFVHNEVLSGAETAEGSALMKNDVIKVRRLRKEEQKMEADMKKTQMQSDFYYFKQFRNFMINGSYDIAIECGGKLKSSSGKGTATAHRAIISKRCPWLKEKIDEAKEKRKLHPIIIPNDTLLMDCNKRGKKRRQISGTGDKFNSAINDGEYIDDTSPVGISPQHAKKMKINREEGSYSVHMTDAIDNDSGDELPEHDDSDDSVQPFPLDQPLKPDKADGAAKVVAEEDDLPQQVKQVVQESRSESPTILSSSSTNNNVNSPPMLWITLDNYPVYVVKLLLEYCYTNRCIPLGQDAFYQLSKGTIVDPFFTKWPNQGLPTITMSNALAGISLAEEARMPRLSHMCEIAATHLLNKENILDALCACTRQSSTSGNPLPVLRKKAMIHFLQRPRLQELSYPGNDFRNIYDKKSFMIIPSMLIGTQEVLSANADHKETKGNHRYWMFPDHDQKDREARNRERQKHMDRRRKRRQNSHNVPY